MTMSAPWYYGEQHKRLQYNTMDRHRICSLYLLLSSAGFWISNSIGWNAVPQTIKGNKFKVLHIDKSTIYLSNGKQFCGETIVIFVLPRSLCKKEKSFHLIYWTTLSKGWEKSLHMDTLISLYSLRDCIPTYWIGIISLLYFAGLHYKLLNGSYFPLYFAGLHCNLLNWSYFPFIICGTALQSIKLELLPL
jgi:hypothetical protein